MDYQIEDRSGRSVLMRIARTFLGSMALAAVGIAVLSPIVTLFGHGELPLDSRTLDARLLLGSLMSRLGLVPLVAALALIASVGLYRTARWARPAALAVGTLLALGAAISILDFFIGIVPDDIPESFALVLFHASYIGGGIVGTALLVFVVQLMGIAIVVSLLAPVDRPGPDHGANHPPTTAASPIGRTAGVVALGGVGALMPLVVRASETVAAVGLRRPELAADLLIGAIGLSPIVLLALASGVGLARRLGWAWDVAPVALVSAWIVVVPLGLMAGLAGLVGDFEPIRRAALLGWFAVAAGLLVVGYSSLATLIRAPGPTASAAIAA